mgnify:CR=1 FL=1
MYLREMGGVELLSREGEIAIAKRIEAGKDFMINGLFQSPLTAHKVFEWKNKLEGKTALNYFNYDTNPSLRPEIIDPSAPQYSHPVIRTHADTGKKSIYVSRLMTIKINDVDKEESKEILNYLFDLIENPSNIYEHYWRANDLVLWDNRCTAHARKYYYPKKGRLLRRMTILDENGVS